MGKQRLDEMVVDRGLVATRSQAESYIKLGEVSVDGGIITKPGHFVRDGSNIEIAVAEQYVSRAALKLASVAGMLGLGFKNKVVLDVGSSTGGFTDYALRRGARKVIAVEIGANQLHASLRSNPNIELHEQTDIRAVRQLSSSPDIVIIDVSFVSLREVLPHVAKLSSPKTEIIAMCKPQFEASAANLKHKGVIKNDRMRRDIFKSFERWAADYFVIVAKADSHVTGAKGNRERFYKLHTL